MLPRNERLTTAQFDRAFAQSQQVRHPLVALRAHYRGDGTHLARAAFVVPKKQAKKASQRNLLRRRLRERYRLHPLRNAASLQGYDLIFLSTPQTTAATGEELDAAFEDILRRVRPRKPPIPQAAYKTVHKEDAVKVEIVQLSKEGSTQVRDEVAGEVGDKVGDEVVEMCDEPEKAKSSVFSNLALGAIRFYQRFISPTLPPACRFEPSCSRYTYASIERFGVVRGCYLGATRICKCHPWHPGGYDPVPGEFPPFFSRSQK